MALVLRNGHGLAARSERFRDLSPEDARALVRAAKAKKKAEEPYRAEIQSKTGKREEIFFHSRRAEVA